MRINAREGQSTVEMSASRQLMYRVRKTTNRERLGQESCCVRCRRQTTAQQQVVRVEIKRRESQDATTERSMPSQWKCRRTEHAQGGRAVADCKAQTSGGKWILFFKHIFKSRDKDASNR